MSVEADARGPLRVSLPRSRAPSREALAEAFAAKRPSWFSFAPAEACAAAWSIDALARRFGGEKVRIIVDAPDGSPWAKDASSHVRDATFAEYVSLLRDPGRTQPCYLALEPLARFPGLGPPAELVSLLGDRQADARISVGSANVQIGVHFDYEDNVFVELSGTKHFTLIAPEYSRVMSASRFNMTQSEIDDASRPDLTRFPRYAEATIIEGEIGPGEALVIPRTWWHHFRSQGETISLGFFMGRASLRRDLAPILRAYGVRYAVGVARQFVVHGLLGRPYRDGLYSHPPNGLVLYNDLKQRLGGRSVKTEGSFFEP